MKKNLTKKLMLSVLTLAFAVVSLGASTFAWFTTMGTADVAPFQGSVVSQEGIEIGFSAIGAAKTDITWKAGNITATEIADLINDINGATAENPWKFNAVTPAAEFAFKEVGAGSAQSFVDVDGNSGAKKYVAFSLHFQLSDNTTDKTYPVRMNQLALTNPSGAAEWDCDTAISLDGSGSVDKQTIADGNHTYKYDVLSATRLALITKDSTTTKYYRAGKSQVAAGSEWTDGFAVKTIGNHETAFGALELYNKKMDRTEAPDHAEYGSYSDLPVAETVGEVVGLNEGIIVGTLTGNQILTINVYLWIEGWDAECLNTLFAQSLSLDLGFKLDTDKATKN